MHTKGKVTLEFNSFSWFTLLLPDTQIFTGRRVINMLNFNYFHLGQTLVFLIFF
jgi:hypothetical protein